LRAALSGLTTRGRSFLAAGVAATVCALLLGQQDLLRVGVLLAGLPLASVVVVARTRYRLACSRRLRPVRVPAGQKAEVVLHLENVSRLPTGVLLIEDQVPYVLGSRPRFVLDRVQPRGVRDVIYPVRSDVRGRFPLGPLAIRLTDPFGMCELNRSFSARDHLIVTPVVHALPAIRLGGEWSGNGDSNARSVAAAGEDDVAAREYRHGDDLRRVHWRSTARRGELMVRREEQPWQSRCTLILDTRSLAHRGDGPGSSFEWAVSAAASISLHLSQTGYSVRLLTDTGAAVSSAAHDPASAGGDFEGMLLDTLAVVTLSRASTITRAAEAFRRSGGDGLLIAVLGAMSTEDTEELSRLRHGSTAALAFLIDTPSWVFRPDGTRRSDGAALEGNARLLRNAGWRTVRVGSTDSLPALWPEAARFSRSEAARQAGDRLAGGAVPTILPTGRTR
jgi:uncharacterized protein (DUF58 family)